MRNASPMKMDSLARIALRLSEESMYTKGKAVSYKNIGIAISKQGVPFDTVLYYNALSQQFAEEVNDYYTIVALLNNNGVGYQYYSQFTKALETFHDALDLHTKHLEENRLKVLILKNIGSVYSSLNENEEAKLNFERAIKLANKLNLSNILNSSADDYALNVFKLGRTEEALDIIDEYTPKFEAAENYQDLLKLKNLAISIHTSTGELAKCLDIISSVDENNIYSEFGIHYCKFLALKTNIYLALYAISKSQDLVEESNQCAEQNQVMETKILAAKNQIDYYFKSNDLKSTRVAQLKYERLLKENFKKEKEFFSDNLYAKFEKDKEKIEINRLNEIASVRNTQLNILIGFSILLLLLTLLATTLQNKYKKSNITLEQKNRDIEFAQKELSKKNVELQKYIESNIQLEQFAHIAAHDLKSPLRVLSSFTGLLKRKTDQKLDTKEKEYFKFIEDSAKQMSLLVQDLLDYSKANSQVLSISKIDLESFLTEILSMLQLTNSLDPNTITMEDCKKTIYADPIKLKQVFQNILSNALKFTQDNKDAKISIVSEDLDDHINFSIADNGIGIPDDYKEIVFNSFTQLNPSKFDGSGIGLSICKKIIERHDGNISITDNHPQGTKINFSISKNLHQN